MTFKSNTNYLNDLCTLNTRELLAAGTQLFSKAQLFFQHSAEQTSSGNLRRQFSTLARLHQQVLYLLPQNHSNDSLPTFRDCSELCHWYQHAIDKDTIHKDQMHHVIAQAGQSRLRTIQSQLLKQLQLQKSMIRACEPGPHQLTLLHFTASLQIAVDQFVDALGHFENFTDRIPQNYNHKINIK